MQTPIRFSLIGRQGCHLCEIAQAEMARIIGELNQRFPSLEYVVEDLDVDFDQELNSLYSDEVPVLLIDGEQVAFHSLDAQRILGIVESKL